MVHLYPLVFWSVGLLYCIQTRPLFCLYVLFMRLNVGALTATSSPFQREKNKLQHAPVCYNGKVMGI